MSDIFDWTRDNPVLLDGWHLVDNMAAYGEWSNARALPLSEDGPGMIRVALPNGDGVIFMHRLPIVRYNKLMDALGTCYPTSERMYECVLTVLHWPFTFDAHKWEQRLNEAQRMIDD